MNEALSANSSATSPGPAHASQRGRSACASWRIGPQRTLPLDRFVLMGVLNVTPDSFSDGGQFAEPAAAAARAMQMIKQGAGIIDIGGESTRPGAQRVEVDEQITRVIPVIETLRRNNTDVAISIDTTRSEVARAALDAGADIINDVAAGDESPDMFALAARRGCGLVLMHRRVPPGADSFSDRYQQPPEYVNVVTQVRDWLLNRVELAQQAGVAGTQIAIDPGLGFGKSVEQNYQLIARIGDFVQAGLPVLGAVSRKSFIGAVCGEDRADHRVAGSVAATVLMHSNGVRLFRIHDVAEHHQALMVATAVGRSARVDGQ